MKNERILKVIERMKENNLSQLIVTSPASIYYLTGKWNISRRKNDSTLYNYKWKS